MKREAVVTVIAGLLSVHAAWPAQTPRLEFEKIIGDMRGCGIRNLSVTATEDGQVCLLMAGGRVAVFNRDGRYQESLRADPSGWWPNTPYLASSGKRILVGLYQRDYPWVYAAQRKGRKAGSFLSPQMVAVDRSGSMYVADAGNTRIQIFSPDDTQTPAHIVAMPSKPHRIAVRGHWLAVYGADRNLMLYERTGKEFVRKAVLNIGSAAACLAFGPDRSVYAAFNGGPNRFWLKRYGMRKGALKELGTVAPSHMDQWPDFFPAGVPMSSGPDGRIWFAAQYGKFLVLDPRTDRIAEVRVPAPRPIAIAFGPKGQAYVGGYFDRKAQRLIVAGPSGKLGQPGWGQGFPKAGVFAPDQNACWGLLPDTDGGVLMRVIERGYRKGWPALTFKKVFPDGTMTLLADYGSLFAVRRKFNAAPYALRFDKDRNIILAALPLTSVLKMTLEGRTIWEAWTHPRGGADKIEFVGPTDLTIDGKGNIWVVDGGANKVFCLSPDGKLLFDYGGYANVDDRKGKGFDNPTGIETVMVNGVGRLYVGDAGNQRIVKYRIAW